MRDEFVLKKGDIITPLTEQVAGLLGETARIPEDDLYIQSGDIGLVTPKPGKLDPNFAYYLLPSPSVKYQLGAAAQQTKIRHTSPDKIEDCIAWIPEDIEDQKKIGLFLDMLNSKITNNNSIISELEAMAKEIYDYWFVQFDFPDENGKPYKSSGGKMVMNGELGREIPEGWRDTQLSEIADITMGQSPAGDSYNENGEGMVFFQGSTDFGRVSPLVRMYTTKPGRIAKYGDMLLSVRAPVGTNNISDRKCCIGRGLAAISGKNNTNEFIYQTVNGLKAYFDIMNNTGTTFGALTKDTLHNIKVLKATPGIIKQFCETVRPMYQKIMLLNTENQELTSIRDYLLPLLMNGQVTFSDQEGA